LQDKFETMTVSALCSVLLTSPLKLIIINQEATNSN